MPVDVHFQRSVGCAANLVTHGHAVDLVHGRRQPGDVLEDRNDSRRGSNDLNQPGGNTATATTAARPSTAGARARAIAKAEPDTITVAATGSCAGAAVADPAASTGADARDAATDTSAAAVSSSRPKAKRTM
jgi:hypothetical protein